MKTSSCTLCLLFGHARPGVDTSVGMGIVCRPCKRECLEAARILGGTDGISPWCLPDGFRNTVQRNKTKGVRRLPDES